MSHLLLRHIFMPLGLICLAGSLFTLSSDSAADDEPVQAAAQSRASLDGPGTPSDVAFLSPTGTEPARVIAALGEWGLEWFTLQGTELGRLEGFDSALVEVLQTAGTAGETVVVSNGLTGQIQLLQFDPTGESLVTLDNQAINLDDELTGLCHGFSTLSRSWQLFGVTDAGMVHQWQVDPTGDTSPQLLRSIPAGKGAGHCVVDEQTRTLYLSHESLGIWSTGAEPESDPAFSFLALNAPNGVLSDEVKGLALVPGQDGAYLVVSDVGAGRLALLEAATGSLLGSITIPGLGEGEGLAFHADATSSYLAIADEDDGPEGSTVVLLDGQSIEQALGLQPRSTVGLGTATDMSFPAVVRPVAETQPVNSFGDAADDPAIWVNPEDPSRSLILGSQKQRGVYLYDLAGNEVQFLEAGRINNVDLRDGFMLNGQPRTLVAGSDRTRKGIALFVLDGSAQRLEALDNSFIATDLTDPYGLCLYRSALDGSYQVFVNDSPDGRTLQFKLSDDGAGGIRHELLREIPVGAQAEGCVVDDDTGTLFVAEEEHGIWKYGAEADAGIERSLVDSIAGGHLVPDVEGLAIWKGPVKNASVSGYLLASNQGRDSYLLYDRLAPHAFRGEFFVVAGNGLDGASETDGLEVTSANLGADYPEGLVVVQDGRNLGPRDKQNYKLLSWRDIRESLGLE